MRATAKRANERVSCTHSPLLLGVLPLLIRQNGTRWRRRTKSQFKKRVRPREATRSVAVALCAGAGGAARRGTGGRAGPAALPKETGANGSLCRVRPALVAQREQGTAQMPRTIVVEGGVKAVGRSLRANVEERVSQEGSKEVQARETE